MADSIFEHRIYGTYYSAALQFIVFGRCLYFPSLENLAETIDLGYLTFNCTFESIQRDHCSGVIALYATIQCTYDSMDAATFSRAGALPENIGRGFAFWGLP